MAVKVSGEQMHVTSFEDLKKYKEGAVVVLPDFAQGQPFVARLRRPSLLRLVKDGMIPNPLLGTVNGLFMNDGNTIDFNDKEMMKKMNDVVMIVVKNSLIEPTMQEIEEAGIDLTDEQKMAIYNYSQSGAEALSRFHTE